MMQDNPIKTLKVKKSDGSIERFNISKIEMVVRKSGCNPGQAKEVKKNMLKWAEDKSQHIHLIGTDEIGKEVFVCLRNINLEAASNFNEFKGFFGGRKRYRYYIPEEESRPGFLRRLFGG